MKPKVLLFLAMLENWGIFFTLKMNSIRFIEITQNALLLIAHNQDFIVMITEKLFLYFDFLKTMQWVKPRIKNIIFDP